MRITREVKKTLKTELIDDWKTTSLVDVIDTETSSPEEAFDNKVIDEYVESLMTELTTKRSVKFSEYNHGEIYRLKLSGYSCNEIGRLYNVTGSFISTMTHWIEKRLRIMVTNSNVV
jgi:DNA-directed RNA polymerase sigma subunit (sigma70/sigma32)